MTNYQLINQNINLVVKMMNNQLISSQLVKELEIYEVFHSLTGNKTQKYERLANKYGISNTTVRRIIKKMNKKIR